MDKPEIMCTDLLVSTKVLVDLQEIAKYSTEIVEKYSGRLKPVLKDAVVNETSMASLDEEVWPELFDKYRSVYNIIDSNLWILSNLLDRLEI